MYELQTVGNASIICFTREIVICYLTSFPLFVFDTTAKNFEQQMIEYNQHIHAFYY